MGCGFSNTYFKSNEVKNSSWMELEGLKRTVTTLKDAGLSIRTLIADCHKQIGSYVKKELHDIWHVAKGRKHNSVYRHLAIQRRGAFWKLCVSEIN